MRSEKKFLDAYTFTKDEDQGVQTALKYGVQLHNDNKQNRFKITLKTHPLRDYTSNIWNVFEAVCDDLRRGFMLMLCGNNERSYEGFLSIAETFHMPFVNWDLAYNNREDRSFNNYEVNLKPPKAELIADLIIKKNWSSIVYMHDEKNGGTVQWINYYLHKKTNESVSTEMIELPLEVENFRTFLRTFIVNRAHSKMDKCVFIDTSSSLRQERFLEVIRTIGIEQLRFHYVVANYDFQPVDVELFQTSNINITGFQIVNRDANAIFNLKKYFLNFHETSTELWQIQNKDSRESVQAKIGFVHDAMLVVRAAFETVLQQNSTVFARNFRHKKMYNREREGIQCSTGNQTPLFTFEHGQKIAQALRKVVLDTENGTVTGHIEFDRFGLRKNFDVTVVDLMSNSRSVFNQKEVSKSLKLKLDTTLWRQGFGFIENSTHAKHSRKPIEVPATEKPIRVITILTDPFVMYKKGCEPEALNVSSGGSGTEPPAECKGNDRFEGYCMDLLKLLAERIENFDYEIKLSKAFGSKQPDGDYDGVIGALIHGEADVCVASLTINQERERVVAFSKPFMTTGISIMIKKPDKQEFSVFSFMQPLSTEIWMYIIFAYVGVSVVIFLVSRFSPYEWRIEEMPSGRGFTISNDFSVYNCLWFTLAAFMQQGTDILPRSISGRIASSAWWFFTMIIVSSYTANLAAFLTLEKMQAPIESVEDLAKQTKIKYGIQQGGSTAQFFKGSSVQMYQRMWRFMESQVPSVFTKSYEEGIERVRKHKGRYAFLLEATANEYHNTRKPCDTMKVGANLNSIGYGVATSVNSPYKDQINLAILALQERGELKKLENKWWYDKGQCDQGINVDGHNASLNLSKVAGIFYILMGGMIASMLAALIEFLYRSHIEARKNDSGFVVGSIAKKLRDSLYAQLRLSLQGGTTAPQGTQAYNIIKQQREHARFSIVKAPEQTSVKDKEKLSSYNFLDNRYDTVV
ncbi:unnamed protein product [Enterobius vermicularis]|uniref:Glutamate receptor 1 n=1 Tax=Enterobius vermicularis TaxID=51028 RepID=A0A3P6I974_ENTVE|nr:unnamed protein product [Enterobius vermicularis]